MTKEQTEILLSQFYPRIKPQWDSWSLNYQSSEQFKRINQVLHDDSRRKQLIEFLETRSRSFAIPCLSKKIDDRLNLGYKKSISLVFVIGETENKECFRRVEYLTVSVSMLEPFMCLWTGFKEFGSEKTSKVYTVNQSKYMDEAKKAFSEVQFELLSLDEMETAYSGYFNYEENLEALTVREAFFFDSYDVLLF
jgi:hypothetical protein